jgi:hypothetical protein
MYACDPVGVLFSKYAMEIRLKLKNKGRPRTGPEGGVEVQSYSFFNLGAR